MGVCAVADFNAAPIVWRRDSAPNLSLRGEAFQRDRIDFAVVFRDARSGPIGIATRAQSSDLDRLVEKGSGRDLFVITQMQHKDFLHVCSSFSSISLAFSKSCLCSSLTVGYSNFKCLIVW